MKHVTKTLFSATVAAGLIGAAGTASAELFVTGGDFESPSVLDGTWNDAVGNWFDSTADNFSSYVYKSSGGFATDSQLLALEVNRGWVYQSLGTRSLGEDTLSVTFDAFERSNRIYGTLEISVYAGAFAGAADGNDIVGAGLTSLGTVSVTASDLSFATPLLADKESDLGYTVGGFDLTGISVGTEVWLRMRRADNGGSVAVHVDNVSVSAVPEPGSLALLGLGGLCVLRRRRS